MKIVILAGGYGTRLSEETDEIPKPLVTIGDDPILWHIIKNFADQGLKEVIIAGGYKW
ncbi:MAG: NTP transferase domain-containing protein, partial [Thermoplasmata archaeon]|nr:NTP transferase domain-containing protein [Thermoplasmata archaeon]